MTGGGEVPREASSAFSGPKVGGFLPGFLALEADDFQEAKLSGSSLVRLGSDGVTDSVSGPMSPKNKNKNHNYSNSTMSKVLAL